MHIRTYKVYVCRALLVRLFALTFSKIVFLSRGKREGWQFREQIPRCTIRQREHVSNRVICSVSFVFGLICFFLRHLVFSFLFEVLAT
jgi:hypothetical protein